uniref:Fanconi anemia group D2 protein n=2 Tax=Lygus hesperus TaxID=30085 RepID=A0A0A9Z4Z6_LYGHE
MYKRRKKALNPQASSTMLSSGLVVSSGPGSTTALSQASTAANSSFRSGDTGPTSPLRTKRSLSPDISTMTTKGTDLIPPSFEKENLNTDVVLRPSQYRSPSARASAKDVLEMLTSPSSSQSSPSPMKRPRLEPPMRTNLNFMEEILHKSGFDLGDGSEPNVLRKDQSVFIREVSRALKSGNLSRNVEDFMRFLKKHIDKKPCFKTALSQTRTDSNTEVSHGEMQESLLRLLLTVDLLQPPLVDLLLDKLAEFILPDLDSNQPDDRIMWVRLIIRSMRYLNKVVDPSKITKSLFDVIHSAPDVMIQTEIVTSIPDITSDEQCADVAQELIDLMKEEPKLSPAVITALSNIGLEGDVLYQVQMSLIKTLRNAPVDQIPAFVKFIINGVDSAHIDEIINGLRSELVLCQVGESASSQIATASNKSDVSSVLVLTFEGIRDAVLMSKKLASSWLKNIGKLKPNKTQKPVDIIMLLIIYASSDQTKKKGVEAVFKSKIKDGTFKETLVDETVEALGEILKTYFNELLKLLSILLNAPDGSVSKFASYFLNECFLKMESLYCRMIILELLESVRLDSKHTKNVLELPHTLTSKFPAKVANYVTLIMLLLDSLPDMKVLEVRQLMDIICSVAWGSQNDSSLDMSSLQDEIIMIVQKQLRCPDSKVFRNGVVCALMVIKHLTCKSEEESNDTPLSEIDQDSLVLNNRSEKAFSFLELIIQGSRSNPEVHVLTYDQLAYVIMNSENMDKSFMKKVSQIMQATLQNHYIIASSDFAAKDEGLDEKLQFCLDNDLADPIVLNLCDAVVSETKRSHSFRDHRTVALPALIRVIRSLELADLTEIDALLGCAIAMPCPNIYTKFSTQDPYIQKIALDCLFHACNWFRETINSFVYMVKEGSPDKIIMRIRGVVYLQTLISRCLSQTAGYSPPSCNIDPSKSGSLDKIKKINPPKKKARKEK